MGLPVGAVVLSLKEAPNPWISPSYVANNLDTILGYLREHVTITVVSVLIGAVIALPLALIARTNRVLSGAILGASTLIYTIPSLAMFAFIVPFTGISLRTVIIGLSLYTLVILVRNFLTGLLAVPAEVREAASGMGYGPARMFFQVELPLALPAFIAGLRIATVSTVALATVGVIVGHGGLGELIITRGFNANFYRAPIIVGSLACVLLALFADLLLSLVERLLTPWTRGRQA